MTISASKSNNLETNNANGAVIRKNNLQRILHENYIPIVNAEIKRCGTLEDGINNWTTNEAAEIYKFHRALLNMAQTPGSIYKTAANYLLNILQSKGVLKPSVDE